MSCALGKPAIGTPFSCCRIPNTSYPEPIVFVDIPVDEVGYLNSVTVLNEFSEALPMRSKDFNPPFAMLK